MDKALRSRIQNATQAARRLLERELGQQLEGDYDLLPDGRVLDAPAQHLDARGRALRARLVAAIDFHRAAGLGPKEARDALLREAAFTTLNRFVALKMLESRGVVQECVSRGDQSSGFGEYSGLAPGLIDLPDRGYRIYLESLCDEIAREVPVLFDRRAVAGMLWPRRPALLELLELLNSPDLADAWLPQNDETIGWVYQYFNGEDERREMRKFLAPRNSRELAVRNQFFTPSYVVQFLADNTLGRIWYEMCRGQTALAEQCTLMLRRPGERFLDPGDQPPADDDLSVPHRSLRDPRKLAILDPAVGSGHYLLYCFQLLTTIYHEAWAQHPQLLADLRAGHDEVSFAAQIPALILAHNLYGVDIDPRAAQIAELALWMHAQSAYAGMELPRGARPQIARANIVVAEPMPGDIQQLEAFLDTVDARLHKLLRQFWKQMQLAGEAGTLLRIERELEDALRAARQSALAGEQGAEGQSALRGAGSEQEFWDVADAALHAALGRYAAEAAGAEGVARRLFAANAEQGVAFLELCRRRYDVVLMNPPFGAASTGWKPAFEKAYPRTKNDLYAAFIERGLELLHDDGLLGAITSRTGFFQPQSLKWRELLLHEARPYAVADLGYGVLDSVVETAAYCLSRSSRGETIFVRLIPEDLKEQKLFDSVTEYQQGEESPILFKVNPDGFDRLPGKPFVYWIGPSLIKIFNEQQRFESLYRQARCGMGTLKDERFLRLWWEVAVTALRREDWNVFAKGGDYKAYTVDLPFVVNFANNGSELKTYVEGKVGSASRKIQAESFYKRPGLTFGRRIRKFAPILLPEGAIFSDSSNSVFLKGDDCSQILAYLGLLNGSVVRFLLNLLAPVRKLEVGFFQRLPVPHPSLTDGERLGELAIDCVRLKQRLDTANELSHLFWLPALLQAAGGSLAERAVAWAALVADSEAGLAANQREIDEIAFRLYGIAGADRAQIEASLGGGAAAAGEGEDEASEDESDDEEEATPAADAASLIADLVSYAVGAALGRWDLRCASGARERPELPDPFAALPVYSPGMLRPEDEAQAPLAPRAVLVDDPGHGDDIDGAVRQVFGLLFGASHAAIYAEAAQALAGGPDLRPYLRGSFFEAHIKRYSKSKRKAPIYWCLSTPGRRYAVWLAYHRADADTLYRAQRDYLGPKIQFEETRAARLHSEGGASPTRAQRAAIEEQALLLAELRLFGDDLGRAMSLWRPERDDGVIINFAPLWRLAPWPRKWRDECRATWERLMRGDYDWSLTAMRLWPARVVPKCHQDRSLAIAHGLDEAFWREAPGERAQPRPLRDDEVQQWVNERESAAVRDALFHLEAAPSALEPPKKSSRARAETSEPKRRGKKPQGNAIQTALDLSSEEEQ